MTSPFFQDQIFRAQRRINFLALESEHFSHHPNRNQATGKRPDETDPWVVAAPKRQNPDRAETGAKVNQGAHVAEEREHGCPARFQCQRPVIAMALKGLRVTRLAAVIMSTAIMSAVIMVAAQQAKRIDDHHPDPEDRSDDIETRDKATVQHLFPKRSV